MDNPCRLSQRCHQLPGDAGFPQLGMNPSAVWDRSDRPGRTSWPVEPGRQLRNRLDFGPPEPGGPGVRNRHAHGHALAALITRGTREAEPVTRLR